MRLTSFSLTASMTFEQVQRFSRGIFSRYRSSNGVLKTINRSKNDIRTSIRPGGSSDRTYKRSVSRRSGNPTKLSVMLLDHNPVRIVMLKVGVTTTMMMICAPSISHSEEKRDFFFITHFRCCRKTPAALNLGIFYPCWLVVCFFIPFASVPLARIVLRWRNVTNRTKSCVLFFSRWPTDRKLFPRGIKDILLFVWLQPDKSEEHRGPRHIDWFFFLFVLLFFRPFVRSNTSLGLCIRLDVDHHHRFVSVFFFSFSTDSTASAHAHTTSPTVLDFQINDHVCKRKRNRRK